MIEVQGPSGEQHSYVVAGAILSCTWGTKRTRLTMPVSHGVYAKDKAQMNIQDYLPNLNIMPFGLCNSMSNPEVIAALKELEGDSQSDSASTGTNHLRGPMKVKPKSSSSEPSFEQGAYVGVPCQPVITTEWMNGKEDTLIEGEPALLSCSLNTCLHCGTITIDDDGQE